MQQEPAEVAGTLRTVGHSNHSIEHFLDLLDQYRIAVLVDVQSSPYSRYAGMAVSDD